LWESNVAPGSGTPVGIRPGESFALGLPTAVPWNLDVSQLLSGLHSLGLRTRDATGRWSDVAWLPIQVQDASTLLAGPSPFPITDTNNWLVSAEYFWDSAPVQGGGILVAVSAGESVELGVPTAIPWNVDVSQL